MDKFVYVSNTLNQSTNIDDEMNTKISKASATSVNFKISFGTVLGANKCAKLQIYKAMVFPFFCTL